MAESPFLFRVDLDGDIISLLKVLLQVREEEGEQKASPAQSLLLFCYPDIANISESFY